MKDSQPFGSVLGVIDSDPEKKLPKAARDHGGNPRGIEVRERATGTDDLPQASDFTTSSITTGENGEAEAEEEQEEERQEEL